MFAKNCQKFEEYYRILAEYFVNKDFAIQEFLRKEIMQLILLLDYLGISYETFLIANFRNYEPYATFRFPYVRYLLRNPVCVKIYQEHHRLYGDSIGIVQYTRELKIIREMRDSSYLWHSADLEFSQKVSDILPNCSDIFKYYVYYKYRNELEKNQLRVGSISSYYTVKDLLDRIPMETLDRIYTEETNR